MFLTCLLILVLVIFSELGLQFGRKRAGGKANSYGDRQQKYKHDLYIDEYYHNTIIVLCYPQHSDIYLQIANTDSNANKL